MFSTKTTSVLLRKARGVICHFANLNSGQASVGCGHTLFLNPSMNLRRLSFFTSSSLSRFAIFGNPTKIISPSSVLMTKRQGSNSPVKASPLKKQKEESVSSVSELKENMAPVFDKVELSEGVEVAKSPVKQEVEVVAKSPVKLAAATEDKQLRLFFAKLTDKAHVPSKGSKLAAGYDLKSAYKYTVPARGSCMVKTDIQIKLPSGYYGRVAPRSGLALKNKIDVGAGVIDEDYRGNVGVILFNFGDVDFEINEGDRVAQLICEKICYPEIVELENLDETERGEAGFGSTGGVTEQKSS